METKDLRILSVNHSVYYRIIPQAAQNEIEQALTAASTQAEKEDLFIYFLKSARKHGFQIFFLDERDELRDRYCLDQFENGWMTPQTKI